MTTTTSRALYYVSIEYIISILWLINALEMPTSGVIILRRWLTAWHGWVYWGTTLIFTQATRHRLVDDRTQKNSNWNGNYGNYKRTHEKGNYSAHSLSRKLYIFFYSSESRWTGNRSIDSCILLAFVANNVKKVQTILYQMRDGKIAILTVKFTLWIFVSRVRSEKISHISFNEKLYSGNEIEKKTVLKNVYTFSSTFSCVSYCCWYRALFRGSHRIYYDNGK